MEANQWQNISKLNQSKFNKSDDNQSEFNMTTTNHIQKRYDHMTETNYHIPNKY